MSNTVWLTAVSCVLILLCPGCDETKEYTPPPLPPIQPSQPEPVPEAPAQPEPQPAMPAAEPMPEPAAPPPRKYTPPNITWHKREWTLVGMGSRRGIGFTVIYRVIANPDNLKTRITLRNREDRTIEVATKRIDNYEGIEYLANGATEAEAPFSALIEYQDPEADLWLPVFDPVLLERH